MKRFVSLLASSAALLAVLGGTAHAAYFYPTAGSYSSRYNSMYGSMNGQMYGSSPYRPNYSYDRSYQAVPNTARVINQDPSTRTIIRTYYDTYGQPLYDKVTTTTSRVIPHAQTSRSPRRGYYNEYDPYDSYNSYNSYSSYGSYNPWMYQSNSWGY